MTVRIQLLLALVSLILVPCAAAQVYSPMYAPSSVTAYTAWCPDGMGGRIPYCGLTWSIFASVNTNAHFHDDPNHVRSWCQIGSGPKLRTCSGYADWNGNLFWNLNASIVGQAEGIVTTSNLNPNPAYSYYAVGYTDIYWNDHPEIWQLVGGGTTQHGGNEYNHWMTSHAAYGIYYTSVAYRNNHPSQTLIAVNDMALPFGGKFDLNRNWASPHAEHDRGTAVDVRGNGGQNGIPNDYQGEFLQRCRDNGAVNAIIEDQGTGNQHIHCRWAY